MSRTRAALELQLPTGPPGKGFMQNLARHKEKEVIAWYLMDEGWIPRGEACNGARHGRAPS